MNRLPTVSDCHGCGVCCLHMGYPAFIQGSDSQPAEPHWNALPRQLKQELMAYIADYRPPPAGELDGPCFWLDQETRLCTHHQDRPAVCRDFTVGSDGCLEWREFYGDRIRTGDSQ